MGLYSRQRKSIVTEEDPCILNFENYLKLCTVSFQIWIYTSHKISWWPTRRRPLIFCFIGDLGSSVLAFLSEDRPKYIVEITVDSGIAQTLETISSSPYSANCPEIPYEGSIHSLPHSPIHPSMIEDLVNYIRGFWKIRIPRTDLQRTTFSINFIVLWRPAYS